MRVNNVTQINAVSRTRRVNRTQKKPEVSFMDLLQETMQLKEQKEVKPTLSKKEMDMMLYSHLDTNSLSLPTELFIQNLINIKSEK